MPYQVSRRVGPPFFRALCPCEVCRAENETRRGPNEGHIKVELSMTRPLQGVSGRSLCAQMLGGAWKGQLPRNPPCVQPSGIPATWADPWPLTCMRLARPSRLALWACLLKHTVCSRGHTHQIEHMPPCLCASGVRMSQISQAKGGPSPIVTVYLTASCNPTRPGLVCVHFSHYTAHGRGPGAGHPRGSGQGCTSSTWLTYCRPRFRHPCTA
jgi:hypothetical protein